MAPRASEELYRTDDDPDQTNNLINSTSHAAIKLRLATLLDRWADETGDDVPDAIVRQF